MYPLPFKEFDVAGRPFGSEVALVPNTPAGLGLRDPMVGGQRRFVLGGHCFADYISRWSAKFCLHLNTRIIRVLTKPNYSHDGNLDL